MIHPNAVIDKTAQIDASAEIGAFAVIGPKTTIKANAKIYPNAVIEYAEIGAGCKIFPGACIGLPPQDLKYMGEETYAVVGDGTVIRECVTVNRGTSASGSTVVGGNCLLMAYSHIAHDCRIGNEVIIANCVAVAGHVEIGEHTVIGGLAGIHQHVRIGKMAMIGAGSMVPLDVPPYAMGSGDRMKLVGLNILGLKRKKFSLETVTAIKKAYRAIFLSGAGINDAVAELEKNSNPAEVKYFIEFIKSSKRGLCGARKKANNEEESL